MHFFQGYFLQFIRCIRPMKRVPIKPFHKDPEAGSVPLKNLNRGTSTIAECKHTTRIWIELKLQLDNCRQAIITFSQISYACLSEHSDKQAYPHDIFILIFSGNSHFSLSALQKDEDNIFILNHRFVPFLLHHQATAVFHLLTFCRIPLLCASFPLKEPRKCG